MVPTRVKKLHKCAQLMTLIIVRNMIFMCAVGVYGLRLELFVLTPLKLKRPTGIGRQCWVCVLVHFFLFFANFRKMLLISRIVAGHALV
jgi:hypothetical protein